MREPKLMFNVDDQGRRMIFVEVSREFFYAVKRCPGELRLISKAEDGVAVIERPHRRRTGDEVIHRLLAEEGIV